MSESISLKPLLKYPGGKGSELDLIKSRMPAQIRNYVEPFVGGGAVYFATKAQNLYYLNDISHELMMLYRYVKSGNKTFFNELQIIIDNWLNLTKIANNEALTNLFLKYRNEEDLDLRGELTPIIQRDFLDGPMFNIRNKINFREFLINGICNKFKLIKKNEIKKEKFLAYTQLEENIEAGIKASYYTYIRDAYNKPTEYNKLSEPRKVALYFFIREYCYSSMFRFNTKGEFNVPYGGISYNKKTLDQKVKYFKSKNLKDLLSKTEFNVQDFETFVNGIELTREDFMFLDPPYDTTFSDYDKNEFSKDDQIRLANYLINECPCKFMLVIKKTDFIYNLYVGHNLNIYEDDKTYFVSFKNRNEKKVTHLTITNY